MDGHPALTAVEADVLDGFWWGEDQYYQFAVARLGRQVLFVQYEGDTDLRTEEAYLASLPGPDGKSNERTIRPSHRIEVERGERRGCHRVECQCICRRRDHREERPEPGGAGAAGAMFTQLGTTLSTIAALQALDQNTAAGNDQAADLSTL